MSVLINIDHEAGNMDEYECTVSDGGWPGIGSPIQLSPHYHLVCGPLCDMDEDGTIHIDPNGCAFTLHVDSEGKAMIEVGGDE